jgi:hypothetical protein
MAAARAMALLTTVAAAPATASASEALLSPAYMPAGAPFGDVLATLALAGLANREAPALWLNSSAKGWVNGVAVMWPYPQADTHWVPYLTKTKGIAFTTAADAKLCTLLGHPKVGAAVKGLVINYANIAEFFD